MANCTYNPQISPGNSNVTPPASTLVLVERDTIELAYPYASPTLTVELRNPEFNDINTLIQPTIIRRSRGHNLSVYKDALWGEHETLAYAFTKLSKAKAESLLEFFETSLGKEVKLTDYLSRVWKGIITNPTEAITQEGRFCSWTAQFLFEGNLV